MDDNSYKSEHSEKSINNELIVENSDTSDEDEISLDSNPE